MLALLPPPPSPYPAWVIALLIGAILALQMAPILRQFGVVERVADIISIAVARELGPLVSAIVLTGFAGASIAAELGTMVVSEEVEALEAHQLHGERVGEHPGGLVAAEGKDPGARAGLGQSHAVPASPSTCGGVTRLPRAAA